MITKAKIIRTVANLFTIGLVYYLVSNMTNIFEALGVVAALIVYHGLTLEGYFNDN